MAKDRRIGFFSTQRKASAGGAAQGEPRTLIPEGRAERLGLRESPPQECFAADLPFAFLRLGEDRRFDGELAGRPEGHTVAVFEFTAADRAAAGGVTTFPYHVAALEIGARLPWFALAQRHVAPPSQLLYPRHTARQLDTGDRRTDREYALHCDDPDAETIVGSAALREWLPRVFGRPIESRTPVALEVSSGWALCAIQARGIAVPEAEALNRAQRLGLPGPWPDALLEILTELRDMVRG